MQLPECPVEITLAVVGDKWKILILRELLEGTKRFGELQKASPAAAQKTLTTHLRELEENGIVNRKMYPQIPPRVEYSLTEMGKKIKPLLELYSSWGEEYKEFFPTLQTTAKAE